MEPGQQTQLKMAWCCANPREFSAAASALFAARLTLNYRLRNTAALLGKLHCATFKARAEIKCCCERQSGINLV
jgi:sugar diacid utilization regulator